MTQVGETIQGASSAGFPSARLWTAVEVEPHSAMPTLGDSEARKSVLEEPNPKIRVSNRRAARCALNCKEVYSQTKPFDTAIEKMHEMFGMQGWSEAGCPHMSRIGVNIVPLHP